jgi:hypothetical protein
MKKLIIGMILATSLSSFAEIKSEKLDCSQAINSTQEALCVIENNKSFLSSIKLGTPKRTLSQIIDVCEYNTGVGVSACNDAQTEVCINIVVNKKYVETYSDKYNDVILGGFKLKFSPTSLDCAQ